MRRLSIYLVVVALVGGIVGCVGGDGDNGGGSHTLVVDFTAGGTVTVADLPIPGRAILTYDPGTVVSLNAIPSAGYRFVEWTGNASTIDDVNAASITITTNDNYSVTANFIAQCVLTTDSTDGGEVAVPGEGDFVYDKGVVVDLMAVPDVDYRFVSWTGDVDSLDDVYAPGTVITINGDYSIAADFETISPFSEHVGASYMTFWKVADFGHWTLPGAGTPLLGQYSSRDPHVAALHIDMAREYGINLFYLDFGWIQPGDSMDTAAQSGLLQADNIGRINICMFYFPDAVVGEGWSQGPGRLFSDFDYLAESYFTHSSYLRYDGRPVVIIPNLPIYWFEYGHGYEDTNELFWNLVGHVYEEFGEELYLIAGVWPDSDSSYLDDSPFEAITVWGNLWASLGDDPDRTYSYLEYSEAYRQIWQYWYGVAAANGVDFVPLVLPGFDDLAYASSGEDRHIIERDHDEFKSLVRYADSLVTADLNMMLLFTWNDFNECTSIEASEEYGLSYLEAVAEAVLVPA